MSTDHYLPAGLVPGQVVARIGLLSDTHMPERLAALPAVLSDVLRGADLILHAGDVGEGCVLDDLSRIAPVIAVHGNDEPECMKRTLPLQQLVAVAGRRILLTHSHHTDPHEEMALRRVDGWSDKLAYRAGLGQAAGASVVVFGHTHIPLVCVSGGVLLVNPGALAAPNAWTRQRLQTIALLYVLERDEPIAVHVDLASPHRAFVPGIDWEAGYKVAWQAACDSILDPELAVVWDAWLKLAYATAFEPCKHALLRVARRCWSGEQVTVTRADLLAELQHEASLVGAARTDLLEVLTRR